jgi:hypothetical protein
VGLALNNEFLCKGQRRTNKAKKLTRYFSYKRKTFGLILWKMSGNYLESDLILRNTGSAVGQSVTVKIRKSNSLTVRHFLQSAYKRVNSSETRLGQQDTRCTVGILEPRSHNRWCRGRKISITYSECVCVCVRIRALVILHAVSMRSVILSSCCAVFPQMISKKVRFKGKCAIEYKMCLDVYY